MLHIVHEYFYFDIDYHYRRQGPRPFGVSAFSIMRLNLIRDKSIPETTSIFEVQWFRISDPDWSRKHPTGCFKFNLKPIQTNRLQIASSDQSELSELLVLDVSAYIANKFNKKKSTHVTERICKLT